MLRVCSHRLRSADSQEGVGVCVCVCVCGCRSFSLHRCQHGRTSTCLACVLIHCLSVAGVFAVCFCALVVALQPSPGLLESATCAFASRQQGTRFLHPLRFFKLEDTAGIIIALVSALMTPSSILSGDSFYADMRISNEIPR